MEEYKINIDKVTEIKDLFYAGWLFKDIKQNEIMLETSNLNFQPIMLKVIFMIVCEGVLNSSRNRPEDPKYEIDYEQYSISDLETLARELTNITGIRFSSRLVF